MDAGRIRAYAGLIVEKGLNLDKGQDVLIVAEPESAPVVRIVTEMCYQAGAGRVVADYRDMALERMGVLYQDEKLLSQIPAWEIARWKWRAEYLPAMLRLDSDDPDGMAGIDQGKRARAQAARFPAIKPFREACENRHQWCIAGVPGVAWAHKVFPDKSESDAVEALWEAILAAARADGDPIANWNAHNAAIHRRSEILNSLGLAKLLYRAGNGTDFSAGLLPQGRFCGAAETDLSGRVFNPNIPSEEIFTTPRRGEAEGVLVATKPLSWQGSLIEDFSIRFENGRAVEVHARKGQDALEKMIAMDEGASYLGECALIGCDSPINRMGILFYSTLYDENASCHVALGRGFNDCVCGYEKYSPDDFRQMGVNDSMIHVDFMIGCDDLEIDGVTWDGAVIPVFRRGNWCF